MTGLLLLLAIGLLVFELWLAVYTLHLMTHPPRRTYASAVARGLPGEPTELEDERTFTSWTFTSRGIELPVWDMPGDNPKGPVVVMTPGWGDSRVGALARVSAIAPVASRIIAWDSPGCGEAPGICSLGTREPEDLLRLLERIEEGLERGHAEGGTEGGTEGGVVLFGWSMGAGIGIVAAARDETSRIAGVITEAPNRDVFIPAKNMLRSVHLPYRVNVPAALWVLGIRFGAGPTWRGFDRATHAGRLRCPLLVIHGHEDSMCPLAEAERIADAATAGRLVDIPGAGHNNLWTWEPSAEACTQAVRAFMHQIASTNTEV